MDEFHQGGSATKEGSVVNFSSTKKYTKQVVSCQIFKCLALGIADRGQDQTFARCDVYLDM